jgi:hypothetical protein
LFYFIEVYEIHQPYSLSFLSFIPPLSSHKYHTHTVPISHYWVSLLIFKSVFKGVSQFTPALGILYFGLLDPFPLLSLTLLPLSPHFSAAFSTYPYILYLPRCYIL